MAAKNIRVTLNGKLFEFTEKIPLPDALSHAKIELPFPCHHSHLSQTCGCGLCVVGLKKSGNLIWKIELACMHTIEDGMEVDTEHPQAEKLRQTMTNAYLLKHPLDCSLCDKVGDCFLHKFAQHTNFRGFTRVIGRRYWQRNLRPLGKKIAMDDAKCIFCGRCLKFCTDILGEEILGKMQNERNLDEIGVYPGKNCDGNYSLNLVDICPAGAMVEICDYSHLAWNLHHTPSISPESSVGINTYILHDGKRVHRIVPRRNDRVNESWMTDSARNLVDILKPNNRITNVMREGERSDVGIAIAFAVNKILLNKSNTCILCSGKTSLEDQLVLKKFMDTVPVSVYFLRRKGDGDGFLISDDPYPNCTGAQIMRLCTEVNTHEDLSELYDMIRAGTFKNIICIYEDLFADGVDSKIFDDVSIIYIGHENNRTAKIANFAFPVKTIFERTGTFVNRDYLLQKFFKAVPPPSEKIFECWEILALIGNTYYFGESNDYLTTEQIWKDLPYFTEIFKDIDFNGIPPDGILLKKS
jgi:NADH-quinone oxidoreductase subunit G